MSIASSSPFGQSKASKAANCFDPAGSKYFESDLFTIDLTLPGAGAEQAAEQAIIEASKSEACAKRFAFFDPTMIVGLPPSLIKPVSPSLLNPASSPKTESIKTQGSLNRTQLRTGRCGSDRSKDWKFYNSNSPLFINLLITLIISVASAMETFCVQ